MTPPKDGPPRSATELHLRVMPETKARLLAEANRRLVSKNLLADAAIRWALDRWEAETIELLATSD